jgi:integrase
MPKIDPSKGGISFTRRGEKVEATYNIPKSDLPEGVNRKRITAWGDSEKEAQKNLLAKLASYKLKTKPPAMTQVSGRTLSGWLDEWMDDYVSERVQESTLLVYKGHIENYIKPYLGNKVLEKLTIAQIKKEWWDKIRELKKLDRDGNPTDEPQLKPFALANVFKTFRMAMKAARQKYNVQIDVSESFFAIPQRRRPESNREIEEKSDLIQTIFFEDLDRNDPRWSQFMLALMGLRQGERLGISIDDIILEGSNPRLLVRNQLAFLKSQGGWYIKDATKNGEPREVPLRREYKEAVEKRLALRQEWSKDPEWNPDPKFENLLFLLPGGKLLTRRQDTPMWHELVGDTRGHLARHVAGHLLLRNGISAEMAQVILGHQSDVYARYYRSPSSQQIGDALDQNYRPRYTSRRS